MSTCTEYTCLISVVSFHYRAMYYSAKRGIAIACRPSVCPSVTLVDQDHVGWKSWKLTARTISPTPSFFVPKAHPPTPRGTSSGNFEKTRGPVRKSGVLDLKSGNISETRNDSGTFTMESLRELTNAVSNGTIPDPLWPLLS